MMKILAVLPKHSYTTLGWINNDQLIDKVIHSNYVMLRNDDKARNFVQIKEVP